MEASLSVVAATTMLAGPAARTTWGLICWLPRPRMWPWPPMTVTTILASLPCIRSRTCRSPASEATTLAVSHHVDAEQGAVQAELVHHGGYGAAGAHDVCDAGLHFRGDGGGEGFHGAVAGLYAAVLGGLEACVVVGHPQVAVEAGGGDAPSRGVLVDVHHLGHARCAEAIPEEGEGCPPGVARGCAEHGRVYLHARGDAERSRGVAYGVEDVSGGAVAAREEEEVDAVAGHLAGGPCGCHWRWWARRPGLRRG